MRQAVGDARQRYGGDVMPMMQGDPRLGTGTSLGARNARDEMMGFDVGYETPDYRALAAEMHRSEGGVEPIWERRR